MQQFAGNSSKDTGTCVAYTVIQLLKVPSRQVHGCGFMLQSSSGRLEELVFDAMSNRKLFNATQRFDELFHGTNSTENAPLRESGLRQLLHGQSALYTVQLHRLHVTCALVVITWWVELEVVIQRLPVVADILSDSFACFVKRVRSWKKGDEFA